MIFQEFNSYFSMATLISSKTESSKSQVRYHQIAIVVTILPQSNTKGGFSYLIAIFSWLDRIKQFPKAIEKVISLPNTEIKSK